MRVISSVKRAEYPNLECASIEKLNNDPGTKLLIVSVICKSDLSKKYLLSSINVDIAKFPL